MLAGRWEHVKILPSTRQGCGTYYVLPAYKQFKKQAILILNSSSKGIEEGTWDENR